MVRSQSSTKLVCLFYCNPWKDFCIERGRRNKNGNTGNRIKELRVPRSGSPFLAWGLGENFFLPPLFSVPAPCFRVPLPRIPPPCPPRSQSNSPFAHQSLP